MENITLHGHFDGAQIQLDEPCTLPPNTKVLITVISPADIEQAAWLSLSAQGLSAAYDDHEPEYPLSLIKEKNQAYERG